MNSERLKTIASFVEKNDTVVDVGCDHGYLSIYLKKYNLCKDVIATDISANALQFAIHNIKKANLKIKTIVSDGLNDVNDCFDTIVIAGMGTHTIKHILNSPKILKIKKIIIQSNNDLVLLRKILNDIGFRLYKNKIVLENGKYYEIMLFMRGMNNNYEEIEFGIFNSDAKEYYRYLVNKYQKILEELPSDNCKRKDLEKKIEHLKKWL